MKDVIPDPAISNESHSIIASSMDGFLMVDMSGAVLEVNDSYCQLVGYSREQLLKMHVFEVEAAHSPEDIAANIEQLRRKGVLRFETRHRHRDGSVIDVEVSASLSTFRSGSIVSFLRDVSSQKRLYAIRQRYEQLVENAGDGIFSISPDGRFLFANEAICAMLGYTRDELLSLNIADTYPEAAREVAKGRLGQLSHGETMRFVRPMVRKDGGVITIEATCWKTVDGDLQSIVRDVTERQTALEALRQSREQFANAFHHAPIGIALVAPDGRWLDVNRSVCDMVGYTREELLALTFQDITHPDDLETDLDQVRQMLAGEISTYRMEKRYINKGGGIVWVLLSVSLVKDSTGVPQHFISQIVDITERKMAGERIQNLLVSEQREKERLSSLFASIDDEVWFADAAGTFTLVNPACRRYFRMDGDEKVEALATRLEVFRPDMTPRPVDEAPPLRALRGEVVTGQEEVIRSPVTGELRHRQVNASPVKASDGRIIGAVAVVRDVTERKRAEEEQSRLAEQVQQAQKLESLGVLAGGIAHDFNNILQIIMGNADILLGLLPENSAGVKENIREIHLASERGAELCRQMLAYAGKTQIVQMRVDVGPLVEETVSLLKSSLPQNVILELAAAAELPTVMVDSGQIRQVVMNLVLNAAEAIGEKQGVVRVFLEKASVGGSGKDRDHLGKEIPSGCYVRMKVTDSGVGMDDEVKKHIFDPFFSTKFAGRGLGMPAVLGIVTAHQGALQFISEPGMGTTILVYLPAVESDSSVPRPKGDDAKRQEGGTVLLVEDEKAILKVASMMLKRLGFDVVEAGNGMEALEAYRTHAADVTVVVTDIDMPVMDGYALICELRKMAPHLPVIVSSGYGEAGIAERIPRGELAGTVDKPYTLVKLREVMEKVTTGPQGKV